jgi:pimeloyl-ACP methyl ester carboxylesterase
MNITTIVLINGLWIGALGWELWAQHYAGKGYRVIASDWPSREGAIEKLRRDPRNFASPGLADVVDHYEQLIRELETPPIIIGHSFGGLVTQILLDRGWGAAGVAIAPAPVKGVRRIPLAMWKIALSALGNPFNKRETTSLSPKQFHETFANTLTGAQSRSVFTRYAVPGPNRVLLQTIMANFTRHAATAVNARNDTRAPLLLVAGRKDRFAPPALVKATFDVYRESKVETDYKEFPDQANFTFLQHTKIADYVLGWALCRVNGSQLKSVSNQTDTWSVQLSA